MTRVLPKSRPNYEAFFNTTASQSDALQWKESRPEVDHPLRNPGVNNEELPFIPAQTVKRQDGKNSPRLCESPLDHAAETDVLTQPLQGL